MSTTKRIAKKKSTTKTKRPRMRFKEVPYMDEIYSQKNYNTMSKTGYKEIKRVVDMANKRIKRLRAGADYSPALRKVDLNFKEGKIKLSNKMSAREMRNIYNNTMEFLNTVTSSVHNSKIFINNLSNKFGISEDKLSEIIKKLNDITINSRGYIDVGDSLGVQAELEMILEEHGNYEEMNEEDKVNYLNEAIGKLYYEVTVTGDEELTDEMIEDISASLPRYFDDIEVSRRYYGF